MAILPAPGFILIELLEKDEKTKQGVYLPQDMQAGEEPMRARVVAVGNSRYTEQGIYLLSPNFNPDKDMLKTDDVIYFKKHTQQELPGYDDKKLALIPFETCIALVTEEENA